MSNFRILLAIVSAIVLFLYRLESFSYEIPRVGATALGKWLGRLLKAGGGACCWAQLGLRLFSPVARSPHLQWPW
jgi:hypothetical protein